MCMCVLEKENGWEECVVAYRLVAWLHGWHYSPTPDLSFWGENQEHQEDDDHLPTIPAPHKMTRPPHFPSPLAPLLLLPPLCDLLPTARNAGKRKDPLLLLLQSLSLPFFFFYGSNSHIEHCDTLLFGRTHAIAQNATVALSALSMCAVASGHKAWGYCSGDLVDFWDALSPHHLPEAPLPLIFPATSNMAISAYRPRITQATVAYVHIAERGRRRRAQDEWATLPSSHFVLWLPPRCRRHRKEKKQTTNISVLFIFWGQTERLCSQTQQSMHKCTWTLCHLCHR